MANVMVISVLERRSEIGLSRALGASRRHVAEQFLAEALLLPVIGGVAGTVIDAGRTPSRRPRRCARYEGPNRRPPGEPTIYYTHNMASAGVVLRNARRKARLSQVELARRAGVTQSVVSAYESGVRQPSVPMLERLVAATGFDLELSVRRPASPRSGPLGERLRQQRDRVREIAAGHGLTNVRVFGSVARGEERPDSDIDLLVDVAPHVGLLELGRCRAELEALLRARVDLVPAADLKAGVTDQVISEARAL
ncbi:MAG: helix-turn-helix domain-containing protein [Acidimicrobiales bacterium]